MLRGAIGQQHLVSVTPSAMAAAIKPSGFIEVTTAALASGTCANKKTAPSPAQRSVFLCNIMRLVIEISECDVIL